MTRNTVLRNSLLLFAGGVISKLFSFLFQTLVARNFGSAAYGRFAIVSSIVLLTATFVTLGFKDSIIKWVGETDNRERLSGTIPIAFGLSLLLSLVASGVIYYFSDEIAIRIFGSDKLGQFMRIVSFALPAIVLVRLTGASLLGLERAGARVLSEEIIRTGTLIALTVVIIAFGHSFQTVGAAYTASFWIAGLSGFFFVLWIAGDEIRATPKYDLSRMLSFSIPLLLSSQVGLLSNWVDTLLVGYYTTEALTGVYQSAFLLGTTVLIFMGAITGSLYPNFSNLVGRGQSDTVAVRYKEATRWAVMFTAAPVVYLSFFPQTSLGALFGSEFTRAWGALVIIAVGNLGGAVVGPGTEIVKASGDSRYVFLTELLGLLINVVLNILLIPILGIIGAAMGTAVMTVVTNGTHFVWARRRFAVELPVKSLLMALTAGGIAGFAGKQVSATVVGIPTLVVHVVFYSVTYVIVLYIIGGFDLIEMYEVIGKYRK